MRAWIMAAIAMLLSAGASAPSQEEDVPVLTSRQATAASQIAQIATALRMFRALNGRCPGSLRDLVVKPGGVRHWPEGGFLTGGQVPRDPWAKDYYFALPGGREIDLWTLGADGKEGGEGEDADLRLRDVEWILSGAAAALAANERRALGSLKTIATAEADFRSNDREGNRVNDFWTGDVRGLAYLLPHDGAGELAPRKQTFTIRLIELAVADADAAPVKIKALGQDPPEKPTPKAGYLFRALAKYVRGGKTLSYRTGTTAPGKILEALGENHNLDLFGFAAFPAEYGKTGKRTFLLNQDNVIWAKDTRGVVPEAFPERPEADGWEKAE